MSEKELMSKIFCYYLKLSPENIWQDGEATQAQANATVKKIHDALLVLFKQLGREVSEQEAYNYNRDARL